MKNVKIWQPLNIFFNTQPTLHIILPQGLSLVAGPMWRWLFEQMHVTEDVAIWNTFDGSLGFLGSDSTWNKHVDSEEITFGSQNLPWVNFTFLGPRDLFIAESLLIIANGYSNTHILWLLNEGEFWIKYVFADIMLFTCILNNKYLPFILIVIASSSLPSNECLCQHWFNFWADSETPFSYLI